MLTYAGFDTSGGAQPLSSEEVASYEERVADFFRKVCIGLDWGLTHLNRDQAESDVWLVPDDMLLLYARFYLKRARRVGWMARSVRQVVQLAQMGDDAQVAADVAKRLLASGMFIGAHGVGPWLNPKQSES